MMMIRKYRPSHNYAQYTTKSKRNIFKTTSSVWMKTAATAAAILQGEVHGSRCMHPSQNSAAFQPHHRYVVVELAWTFF